MAKNQNLHLAKRVARDEFYTQLTDIERELRHYEEKIGGGGKIIYCNCDDPRVSNFFKFFSLQFERLGLKKLITTCYKNQQPDLFSQHDAKQAIYLEYTGDKDGNRIPDPHEINVYGLQGDGDFRSPECIELLGEADIVVTNPPFSLFREYVAQLMEYEKKFLITGPKNAITYKEIFPFIKANKMWLGIGGVKEFEVRGENDGKARFCQDRGRWYQKFGNVGWFTNLEHSKRNEELVLYRNYSPEEHPKYDNYDAIEVSKVKNIPMDWDGVMGVPITFLDKYNPEQFELLGATESEGKGFSAGLWNPVSGIAQAMVNGKRVYKRLFIRNKRLR